MRFPGSSSAIEADVSSFGRETVEGLVRLGRDLSQAPVLADLLPILAEAISDVAEFGCAAINLVIEDGDLVVAAVSGPSGLEETLLGTVGSRASWDREIALADRHGAVHLSLSGPSALDDLPVWVSDDESWFSRTAADPKAWRPEYALYVPMYDAADELIGVISVDLPMSGLMPDSAQLAALEVVTRQAEAAIAAAQTAERVARDEHLLGSVLELSGSAMCVVNGSGRLTRVNRLFRDVFGHVVDVGGMDRLVTQMQGGESLSGEVSAVLAQPSAERTVVIATGAPDERSWFRVAIRGVGREGSTPTNVVCTLADVTGERRVHPQLDHDAEHDALTGLLNRRGVRGAAATVIGACLPGDFFVTMFCDLDGFTKINNQHGHAFGDEVLRQVAAALQSAAPDPAVIGRVGGDEFVVFLSCSSIHEAQKVADTLVRTVAVPVPGSPDVVLTTSVGVAMDDSDPRRGISDLMQAADEALHRAKLAGGGRWMSAPIP